MRGKKKKRAEAAVVAATAAARLPRPDGAQPVGEKKNQSLRPAAAKPSTKEAKVKTGDVPVRAVPIVWFPSPSPLSECCCFLSTGLLITFPVAVHRFQQIVANGMLPGIREQTHWNKNKVVGKSSAGLPASVKKNASGLMTLPRN
eukprot:g27027.t1